MTSAPPNSRISAWLHPPIQSLVRWEESGDALIWNDDSIVVFREELVEILTRLETRGLPPAGLSLLILAASRGKVLDRDEVEVLRVMRVSGKRTIEGGVDAGLDALARISRLPSKLKGGVAERANLLCSLIGDLEWGPPIEVREFLHQLEAAHAPSLWPKATSTPNEQLELDLFRISKSIARGTEQALELALRTGLESLPQAASVDLPIGAQVHALLNSLATDVELAPLATLTREIMAAVNLPRALPESLAEATGGLGDIGIRGPLHRLLLSELAHDDDTLAARIALNEALYLRPEPSAQPPPTRLVILIDSGVRLWGLPRVFATAASLACLGRSFKESAPVAFRASGRSAIPVQLHHREGLVSHLAALETEAEPSAALPALVQAIGWGDEAVDVLIVTHPFALKDKRFDRALNEQRHPCAWYAITVDRDGHLQMQLRAGSRWLPISEARLDLTRLLAATARKTIEPKETLPAILKVEPLPFGLPVPGKVEHSTALDIRERGIAINNRGTVWNWNGTRSGARRVSTAPLTGTVLDLFYHAWSRQVIGLSWQSKQARLSVLRVGSVMEANTFSFDGFTAKPNAWWLCGEVLMVTSNTEVWAISLQQGRVLGREPLFWAQSRDWRFGTQQERWVTLERTDGGLKVFGISWNGSISYEEVRGPGVEAAHKYVLAIFRCRASEEIYVLDGRGRIFATNQAKPLLDLRCGAITGHSINRAHETLRIETSRRESLFISLNGNAPKEQHGVDRAHDFNYQPHPYHWTVRHRFSAIALAATGNVFLRALKGYWVAIAVRKDGLSLHFDEVEDSDVRMDGALHAAFGEPMKYDPDTDLYPAVFPDSSRAWMDSRGLLHLQSSDPSVPEISIVLAESSSLPAWTSDGTLIGAKYFTGKDAASQQSVAKVDDAIRRFVRTAR